jgi:hypothetical protein
MITTTNKQAIDTFLEKQSEIQTHPICKHCGKHTEKYRIRCSKGNVCQACQKTKNAMKVKTWYYQKKGWTEQVKKMNRLMERFSGSNNLSNKTA